MVIKQKSKMKSKWHVQRRPTLEKMIFARPPEANKFGKTYLLGRHSLHFTRESSLGLFKYETLLEHLSRREKNGGQLSKAVTTAR